MKRALPCPCCGKRLTDTEDTVSSRTIPVFKLMDSITKHWIPDYYIKCWNCRQEIAVKKVS